MTDSTLNRFVASGTNAQRIAFTPAPPTPGSGPAQGYFWYETDTGDTYSWKASTSAWVKVNTATGGGTTTNALTITNTGGAAPGATFNGSAAKTIDYSTVGAAKAGAAGAGGRLTLVTGTPVMNADATAQTAIYYTPYRSDIIPIYDGSQWATKSFTELTLTLDTTNHVANSVYDVFVWNNSGTISVGTGPAWSFAATVTMTIATPAVITWTAHGLNEGDPVVFTTTGALPTGITAGTTYFVSKSPTTNAFNISTSVANAAAGTLVATSGSQSGTHTATNGTRSRGTGAGTTELQMLNGIWTNKNSITLKNGAGSGTAGIAANTATYVGSFYATAAGQTGMSFKPAAATGGTNNILGLYNAYNRVPIIALSRDSTATWTYGSSTWRAANASSGNRISCVDGLQQSAIFSTYTSHANGTSVAPIVGVTLDSTTAIPEIAVQSNVSSSALLIGGTAREVFLPQIGFHFVQAMEVNGAGTATFFGAAAGPPTRQLNALTIELEM